jgi:carboxyl-terminal processing protease
VPVSRALRLVSLLALVCLASSLSWTQQFTKLDRDRVADMLHDVSTDIKKHYYDPKFHGVDWDARVAQAKGQIDKADSLNMAMSHLAAALDSLNDSHTFFLPPSRPYRHDYGFRMQMFGDHCYVLRVRPTSDAAAKGLKPGDEILGVNGFQPARDNLWKMEYVYNTLRPQPGLRLKVKAPDGTERQVDVLAKQVETRRVTDLTGSDGGSDIWDVIRESENEERMMRGRYVDVGDDIVVLKVPEFMFSDSEVVDMMGKVRKHQALVLDLRGNPGGSVQTLKMMLGCLFDKDVKIADRVERDKTQPMIAKAVHHSLFDGKVVVLVDSRSASASELFARVVQIEKRGTVIGDRSSGSVMESKHYPHHSGMDTVVFFGASITDADLIMTDGKSLEHTGVIPDEIILPTASDLAEGRDPALARAVETLGSKVSPQAAGKMFPFEWPRE